MFKVITTKASMVLPSSGPISLTDVAEKFGGTTPHSLSEYYGVAANASASGAISLEIFRGKSQDYVSCGTSHTFFITDKLYGHGSNSSYQLGTATFNTSTSAPIADANSRGSLIGKTAAAVACGGGSTHVLASDGTLHAFGRNSPHATLGDGTVNQTSSPVLINGGSLSGKTVKKVACGSAHSLVLATDGTLHGFGNNYYGEARGNGTTFVSSGSGTLNPYRSPSLINGGSLSGKTVKNTWCGYSKSMALATDGTFHYWGWDTYGTESPTLPKLLNTGSLSGKTVASAAGSNFHTMIVATDGTLHGWGFNTYGNLGDGTIDRKSVPVLINGGSLSGKTVAAVACGEHHTMVIATDGTLHGFGYNVNGQLGDGTTTQRNSPILINGGSLSGKTVAAVACGSNYTYVFAKDRTRHGFGFNGQGQLADGTFTNRTLPVSVSLWYNNPAGGVSVPNT